MSTKTETRPDLLSDLDFRPACACQHPACDHPDDTECGAPADAIMTFHIVNHCTTSQFVDGEGNYVHPICQPCVDRVVELLEQMVARLRARARRAGRVGMCGSCGAPIMQVSDIVRDVRPLR
ncbi:hypothetical protein [Mycolicibacterium sp.]|uniref:hypothetical protein n=1 Tax=Mycolicibacterium sp. TaxID=2320850 RepID=UPI00355CFD4A